MPRVSNRELLASPPLVAPLVPLDEWYYRLDGQYCRQRAVLVVLLARQRVRLAAGAIRRIATRHPTSTCAWSHQELLCYM